MSIAMGTPSIESTTLTDTLLDGMSSDPSSLMEGLRSFVEDEPGVFPVRNLRPEEFSLMVRATEGFRKGLAEAVRPGTSADIRSIVPLSTLLFAVFGGASAGIGPTGTPKTQFGHSALSRLLFDDRSEEECELAQSVLALAARTDPRTRYFLAHTIAYKESDSNFIIAAGSVPHQQMLTALMIATTRAEEFSQFNALVQAMERFDGAEADLAPLLVTRIREVLPTWEQFSLEARIARITSRAGLNEDFLFLKGIASKKDDDSPRLIYSDWRTDLEGYTPLDAELILLQVRGDSLLNQAKIAITVNQRADALERGLSMRTSAHLLEAAAAPFLNPFIGVRAEFRRGMPSSLGLGWRTQQIPWVTNRAILNHSISTLDAQPEQFVVGSTAPPCLIPSPKGSRWRSDPERRLPIPPFLDALRIAPPLELEALTLSNPRNAAAAEPLSRKIPVTELSLTGVAEPVANIVSSFVVKSLAVSFRGPVQEQVNGVSQVIPAPSINHVLDGTLLRGVEKLELAAGVYNGPRRVEEVLEVLRSSENDIEELTIDHFRLAATADRRGLPSRWHALRSLKLRGNVHDASEFAFFLTDPVFSVIRELDFQPSSVRECSFAIPQLLQRLNDANLERLTLQCFEMRIPADLFSLPSIERLHYFGVEHQCGGRIFVNPARQLSVRELCLRGPGGVEITPQFWKQAPHLRSLTIPGLPKKLGALCSHAIHPALEELVLNRCSPGDFQRMRDEIRNLVLRREDELPNLRMVAVRPACGPSVTIDVIASREQGEIVSYQGIE